LLDSGAPRNPRGPPRGIAVRVSSKDSGSFDLGAQQMQDWLKQTWARLKCVVKSERLNRDLDDELAFHLAKREEANRAAGMDAQEANYAAKRNLGNVTRLKEVSREMWTFASLETMWQDLRYGA